MTYRKNFVVFSVLFCGIIVASVWGFAAQESGVIAKADSVDGKESSLSGITARLLKTRGVCFEGESCHLGVEIFVSDSANDKDRSLLTGEYDLFSSLRIIGPGGKALSATTKDGKDVVIKKFYCSLNLAKHYDLSEQGEYKIEFRLCLDKEKGIFLTAKPRRMLVVDKKLITVEIEKDPDATGTLLVSLATGLDSDVDITEARIRCYAVPVEDGKASSDEKRLLHSSAAEITTADDVPLRISAKSPAQRILMGDFLWDKAIMKRYPATYLKYMAEKCPYRVTVKLLGKYDGELFLVESNSVDLDLF